MERLTFKHNDSLLTDNQEHYENLKCYQNCVDKLGKLEDLFELYNINSLEELELILGKKY